MIRGAHVHVKWLKTLEVRPCTWSALKHVNPRTGSSASPLHAPSASSSPISNHSRTQPGGGVVQYRKFHSTDFRTNDSNFRWGVPGGERGPALEFERTKGWKVAGSKPGTHRALCGATPMVLSHSAHESTRRPKATKCHCSTAGQKAKKLRTRTRVSLDNNARRGRKPAASSFPFVGTRSALR